jgi:glycerophosphoryl diester phosphodiesterase
MKNKRPLIIAHRGFSGKFLENSRHAVRAALDLGADMVEIDVHETRDGQIVVFHDYNLRRIFGRRARIRDLGAAELPREIPKLSEILQMCRGRARVLIEIKRASPEKIAQILRETGMERDAVVFSLSLSRMRAFAKAAPNVERFGIVARHFSARFREWKRLGVSGIGAGRRVVNARSVRKMRGANMKIFVWTVNSEREMRRILALGVDGIITDWPDRLKKLIS